MTLARAAEARRVLLIRRQALTWPVLPETMPSEWAGGSSLRR